MSEGSDLVELGQSGRQIHGNDATVCWLIKAQAHQAHGEQSPGGRHFPRSPGRKGFGSNEVSLDMVALVTG